MGYKKVEILENKEISPSIYLMKVKGEFDAKPGQFYMIKCFEDTNLLPRPISICDIEGDTLVLLYAVVGKGTKIMSEKKIGEEIEVLGPLGNGFYTEGKENKKLAIVGGGIGIAPLLYLAKNLNAEIDLYLGYRDEVYFVDEFKPYVNNIFITTNTGSVGHEGYVTEILEDKYDEIFVCGPEPMMGAIKKLGFKSPIQLSMESRMACGIGACLACSCKTSNGMKRMCKEGPVFYTDEVML